jgi:transketolase C-terminal domain/subunit
MMIADDIKRVDPCAIPAETGLGGAVAEALGRKLPLKMGFVGVGNCFTESGDYDELLEKHGVSARAVVAKAKGSTLPDLRCGMN